MTTITPVITHPSEVWLVSAMPILVLAAVMLLSLTVLHRPLQRWLAARPTAQGMALPAALIRPLDSIPAPVLLGLLLLAMSVGVGLTLLVGGVLVTLLAAPLVTAGVLWALLAWRDARSTTRLTAQLIPAVGDVVIQLQGGVVLSQALRQVVAALPAPLGAEWQWLLAATNRPIPDAQGHEVAATLKETALALAEQTPSRRHARFLRHLAAVADKEQTVQVARLHTVVTGMRRSDMRERETQAALSELKYGGMFIGLCTTGTLLYAVSMMADQASRAFAGLQGLVAGAVLLLAVLAPVVAGILASRSSELDY